MANILIVLSEETSPLVAMAAEAGHRVAEAQNSGEALREIMRQHPEAVIILDDGEPVEGVELLSIVRRMTKAAIIVVGKGGERRIAQALFQGADAYLTHPVDAGALRSRLRALLRRPSERRRSDGGRSSFRGK